VSIDFSKNLFCYQIKVNNLADITGAHIHALIVDNQITPVQDEVFIALNYSAVIKDQSNCLKVDNQTLSEIGDNPTHYFLMIHTKKFQDGAIGGILQPVKN
jgi:hypothetical protein